MLGLLGRTLCLAALHPTLPLAPHGLGVGVGSASFSTEGLYHLGCRIVLAMMLSGILLIVTLYGLPELSSYQALYGSSLLAAHGHVECLGAKNSILGHA